MTPERSGRRRPAPPPANYTWKRSRGRGVEELAARGLLAAHTG
jgi:hypothetical protein